jgi:hypothetical protein
METGFYWARAKFRYGFSVPGYSMIVAIYGREPFLRVKGWFLDENTFKDNVDIDLIDIGPMIEQPQIEEIEDGK